jgi:hypothetical protein
VLTQAMLMLAGGGESCADIETLASQRRLFGEVCSDSTLYRTFTETLDTEALKRAREAMAGTRSGVWKRLPLLFDDDGPVILDIDASLVEIHSENKEGTAANFKHGFGFHPLFCFSDAIGEALAASLRPGNATANDASDLLGVLDAGISQLPESVASGHRPSDDPEAVTRPILVRSDSAGASRGFVEGCRNRNIGFQVVARRNAAISAAVAVANTDPDRWQPALNQDGTAVTSEDGHRIAEVCEVTDLVDLSVWPEGTRLIVRREPLHPGAQQSLLPDLDYRFWGHYTDQASDPAELDRLIRAHAHVEDHIGRLKDSGLLRFPFASFEANQAWLQVVCWAADLVRWFQLLCLTGPLTRALPKRLRCLRRDPGHGRHRLYGHRASTSAGLRAGAAGRTHVHRDAPRGESRRIDPHFPQYPHRVRNHGDRARRAGGGPRRPAVPPRRALGVVCAVGGSPSSVRVHPERGSGGREPRAATRLLGDWASRLAAAGAGFL